MEFTRDQEQAKNSIIQSVKEKKGLLTVGGFAGTGKTTVLAHSIFELRKQKKQKNLNVAFCCLTGKASLVLKRKLENAKALNPGDYCGTIHSLIYKRSEAPDGTLQWVRNNSIPFDLLIMDEASMISEPIFKDLQGYGLPMVAVGDHGQLPPIQSDFNLMQNPMIRLEIIHRQAAESPIIAYSRIAREGGRFEVGSRESKGEYVFISDARPEAAINDLGTSLMGWMILCGMNKTRVKLNNLCRLILKHSDGNLRFNGTLNPGEKVICLKNNRMEGIYNGMVGEVLKSRIDHDFLNASISFDGDFVWDGSMFRHQFNSFVILREWQGYDFMDMQNLFDFGYVITVHKSQGSEADNVLLIDENMSFLGEGNYHKWRYTGITRAKKNLKILTNL